MSVFASFFITHHELASRIIAVLPVWKNRIVSFAKQGLQYDTERIRAWSPGVEVFHTDQYVQD